MSEDETKPIEQKTEEVAEKKSASVKSDRNAINKEELEKEIQDGIRIEAKLYAPSERYCQMEKFNLTDAEFFALLEGLPQKRKSRLILSFTKHTFDLVTFNSEAPDRKLYHHQIPMMWSPRHRGRPILGIAVEVNGKYDVVVLKLDDTKGEQFVNKVRFAYQEKMVSPPEDELPKEDEKKEEEEKEEKEKEKEEQELANLVDLDAEVKARANSMELFSESSDWATFGSSPSDAPPSSNPFSPPKAPSSDPFSPPKAPSSDPFSPPKAPSADPFSPPPKAPSCDPFVAPPPKAPNADPFSLPSAPSSDPFSPEKPPRGDPFVPPPQTASSDLFAPIPEKAPSSDLKDLFSAPERPQPFPPMGPPSGKQSPNPFSPAWSQTAQPLSAPSGFAYSPVPSGPPPQAPQPLFAALAAPNEAALGGGAFSAPNVSLLGVATNPNRLSPSLQAGSNPFASLEPQTAQPFASLESSAANPFGPQQAPAGSMLRPYALKPNKSADNLEMVENANPAGVQKGAPASAAKFDDLLASAQPGFKPQSQAFATPRDMFAAMQQKPKSLPLNNILSQ